VQVSTSLAQVEQTQRQLLTIVAAGAPSPLPCPRDSGALGPRGPAPIDQITQTALAISHTEDLSRRLEITGPQDEVGRLASTF